MSPQIIWDETIIDGRHELYPTIHEVYRAEVGVIHGAWEASMWEHPN
jgi:hypothetical protein